MDPQLILPLLRLQETDQEIERIERRLRKIEEERKALLKELEEAEGRLSELENSVEKKRKELKELKEKIEEEERALENTERKLTRVRKDVEYKALLREKSKHEDNILKMSYELDDISGELESLKEEVSREKPKLERRIKDIKEELDDLDYEEKAGKRKLEDLVKQREERCKSVEQSLLNFYEEARKRFENGVIVKVEEEVCTGCGMKVPDVLFSKMLKDKSIEVCPSCGRYIYYKL